VAESASGWGTPPGGGDEVVAMRLGRSSGALRKGAVGGPQWRGRGPPRKQRTGMLQRWLRRVSVNRSLEKYQQDTHRQITYVAYTERSAEAGIQ
jgi:hypothetical protein